MSWAVKHGEGFRIYSKGGAEVILPRCSFVVESGDKSKPITEPMRSLAEDVTSTFASEAMRTIAFAYRDLPANVDWALVDGTQFQPDGSPAFAVECALTLVAVTGIEDPLRDEVPGAIQNCYTAGIDVRMVCFSHFFK